MTEFIRHSDQKRIFRHVLFWFIWICTFTFIQGYGFGAEGYKAWLFYYLVTLPLFVAHAYAIACWLVPRYFFRSKYIVFSAFVLIFLMLSSIAELILSNEFIWKMVRPQNIQQGNYLNWQNVLINGFGNEYIIIVFLAIKVVRFRDSNLIEQTALASQKLSTEIELIQYQAYPRFVLNVMDRLEQLAVQGSPRSSEMIIGLSNLMSNMIETRKTGKILLNKEIEIIKAYTDIQKIKLSRDLKVEVIAKGELNRIRIPPFLFFQLVEEGFTVMESEPENSDFIVKVTAHNQKIYFSMILWNPELFHRKFNSTVMENCHKYLNYFYLGNHKVVSNFELNFVDITIEINT